MQIKKLTSAMTALALALSLCPAAAAGEDPDVFVLMNIPYQSFYAEEGAVDAITSATLNGKARNVNVNGASYHQSADSVTTEGMVGMTYPVKLKSSQLAQLKALGGVEVTATDTLSYEMNARGTVTTVSLEGKSVLQESPSYSYYVVEADTVAGYKELSWNSEEPVFGAAVATANSHTLTQEVQVSCPGRHANVEMKLEEAEVNPADVSGVIITTETGSYALHHVVNIWRGTEIGWNLKDLDLGGQTIQNVRYFLRDGSVEDYAANIPIPDFGYVLMNIPYDRFYAAELGESGEVDAVTSPTLKYANPSVAGGSYHSTDATDAQAEVTALGVTYPVFVKDLSALDPGVKVTDETSGTIHTVSGREKTITETQATGKDLLFCADGYSWYPLSEIPARYKTLTVEGDGSFTFGAVNGRATTVTMEPTASYHTHHGNFVEIRLGEIKAGEETLNLTTVYGVVVTFSDGTQLALPHVQGIWQRTQIGWHDAQQVQGKTITGVKLIAAEGVYTAEVELPIKKDLDTFSASFADASHIAVTGLPADIANAKVTVQTVVGRGETPVVLVKDASVENGRVALSSAAAAGVNYAMNLVSDNYADLSVTALYAPPAQEDTDSGDDDSSSYQSSVSQPQTTAGNQVTVTSAQAEAALAEGRPIRLPVTVNASSLPVSLTVTLPETAAGLVQVEIPLVGGGPGVVACVRASDNSLKVVRDCVSGETLVASLEKSGELVILDNTKHFADVPVNAPYADSVTFVASREIFNGCWPTGNFLPDVPLNRAMAAQVFYNLARNSVPAAQVSFRDVNSRDWFSTAAGWAVHQGILEDRSGTFAPQEEMTCRDLAVSLYHFAKSRGNVAADPAADAYAWAVKLLGSDVPEAETVITRATAAQLLRSFLESIR